MGTSKGRDEEEKKAPHIISSSSTFGMILFI